MTCSKRCFLLQFGNKLIKNNSDENLQKHYYFSDKCSALFFMKLNLNEVLQLHLFLTNT